MTLSATKESHHEDDDQHYRHPQHFGGRCSGIGGCSASRRPQMSSTAVKLKTTADVPLSKRTVTGIHCLSSTDLAGHRIHPIQSDTATSTFHASQTANRVRSGMQRRHNSFLPAYLEKYCVRPTLSRGSRRMMRSGLPVLFSVAALTVPCPVERKFLLLMTFR
jgi:hypothetical protein